MSLSKEVALLEERLRKAQRIIDQAYRHAASASKSGDLAFAICAPLIEILTMPLEREDEARKA